MDAYSQTRYDFFTDSSISFLQPFGSSGAFQLEASALRKNIIGGLSKKYGGSIALKGKDLSLVFKGGYDNNVSTVDSILKGDEKLSMDLTLSIGYLDTLPVVLSYSHLSGKKTEGQSLQVNEYTGSDKVSLGMAGSIGEFGLNVSSSFQDNDDKLNNVKSVSFSNSISVLSPSIKFFKIRASVSPDYNKVEYGDTSNTVESTTLSSELGVNIPLNEELIFDIYGGRLDTWLIREGPDSGTSGVDYFPWSAAWSGGTSLEYKGDNGITAQTKYQMKAGDGLFDHSISASGSYAGKDESVLKDAELKGEFSRSYSENWTLSSDTLNWSAAAELAPSDKMLLSASYSGSTDSFAVWTHTGKTTFSHSPAPIVDYNVSASVSDSITGSADTLKQQYGGAVNLKPQWNMKAYLFGIEEEVLLSEINPPGSQTAVSTMTYNMGIPVSSFLRARYNLKWEWAGESNFQHLFGISLSGDPVPLVFTADYLLNHGTRGVRHDVNSTLSIPLWGAFSVEGRFSMSYYNDGGAEKLPFLFGVNAAYRF